MNFSFLSSPYQGEEKKCYYTYCQEGNVNNNSSTSSSCGDIHNIHNPNSNNNISNTNSNNNHHQNNSASSLHCWNYNNNNSIMPQQQEQHQHQHQHHHQQHHQLQQQQHQHQHQQSSWYNQSSGLPTVVPPPPPPPPPPVQESSLSIPAHRFSSSSSFMNSSTNGTVEFPWHAPRSLPVPLPPPPPPPPPLFSLSNNTSMLPFENSSKSSSTSSTIIHRPGVGGGGGGIVTNRKHNYNKQQRTYKQQLQQNQQQKRPISKVYGSWRNNRSDNNNDNNNDPRKKNRNENGHGSTTTTTTTAASSTTLTVTTTTSYDEENKEDVNRTNNDVYGWGSYPHIVNTSRSNTTNNINSNDSIFSQQASNTTQESLSSSNHSSNNNYMKSSNYCTTNSSSSTSALNRWNRTTPQDPKILQPPFVLPPPKNTIQHDQWQIGIIELNISSYTEQLKELISQLSNATATLSASASTATTSTTTNSNATTATKHVTSEMTNIRKQIQECLLQLEKWDNQPRPRPLFVTDTEKEMIAIREQAKAMIASTTIAPTSTSTSTLAQKSSSLSTSMSSSSTTTCPTIPTTTFKKNPLVVQSSSSLVVAKTPATLPSSSGVQEVVSTIAGTREGVDRKRKNIFDVSTMEQQGIPNTENNTVLFSSCSSTIGLGRGRNATLPAWYVHSGGSNSTTRSDRGSSSSNAFCMNQTLDFSKSHNNTTTTLPNRIPDGIFSSKQSSATSVATASTTTTLPPRGYVTQGTTTSTPSSSPYFSQQMSTDGTISTQTVLAKGIVEPEKTNPTGTTESTWNGNRVTLHFHSIGTNTSRGRSSGVNQTIMNKAPALHTDRMDENRLVVPETNKSSLTTTATSGVCVRDTDAAFANHRKGSSSTNQIGIGQQNCDPSQDDSDNEDGMILEKTPSSTNTDDNLNPEKSTQSGLGRGRVATLPAWYTKQLKTCSGSISSSNVSNVASSDSCRINDELGSVHSNDKISHIFPKNDNQNGKETLLVTDPSWFQKDNTTHSGLYTSQIRKPSPVLSLSSRTLAASDVVGKLNRSNVCNVNEIISRGENRIVDLTQSDESSIEEMASKKQVSTSTESQMVDIEPIPLHRSESNDSNMSLSSASQAAVESGIIDDKVTEDPTLTIGSTGITNGESSTAEHGIHVDSYGSLGPGNSQRQGIKNVKATNLVQAKDKLRQALLAKKRALGRKLKVSTVETIGPIDALLKGGNDSLKITELSSSGSDEKARFAVHDPDTAVKKDKATAGTEGSLEKRQSALEEKIAFMKRKIETRQKNIEAKEKHKSLKVAIQNTVETKVCVEPNANTLRLDDFTLDEDNNKKTIDKQKREELLKRKRELERENALKHVKMNLSKYKIVRDKQISDTKMTKSKLQKSLKELSVLRLQKEQSENAIRILQERTEVLNSLMGEKVTLIVQKRKLLHDQKKEV